MPRYKPIKRPADHKKQYLRWIQTTVRVNEATIRECSSYTVVSIKDKEGAVLTVEVWNARAIVAGCKDPIERWALLLDGTAKYEAIRPSILASDGRPGLSRNVRMSLPARIRGLKSHTRELSSYKAAYVEIRRWYQQLFKRTKRIANKQPLS